jgi:flagellar protein FliL
MKKIFLMLGALLLVGGGGAGAYLYFMKPAEAAQTEEGHEEKADKKEAKKGHGEGAHVEFVELDPLILPIIDENGVNQTVSLVIAIEVSDSANAGKVTSLSPRLKDAYIQEMYGVLNKHAALKGGIIQVNMIKERLNEISVKVLGEDVVDDVLLQVVQQRPV